jgi:hypothetical protein
MLIQPRIFLNPKMDLNPSFGQLACQLQAVFLGTAEIAVSLVNRIFTEAKLSTLAKDIGQRLRLMAGIKLIEIL